MGMEVDLGMGMGMGMLGRSGDERARGRKVY